MIWLMRMWIGTLSMVSMAVLLSSCTMTQGITQLEAHELLLYGDQPTERITWIYGNLKEGSVETDLKIGTQIYKLRNQISDPFGLVGTLSLNTKATLRGPVSSVSETFNLSSLPFSSDLVVGTKAAVDGIYYTDGFDWYRLARAVKGDLRGKVSPTKISDLHGVGKLTDAEADLLSSQLKKQAPVAIGLMPENQILDAPQYIEPSPQKYLQTAFYVQKGVPTDLNIFVPDLTPPNSGKYTSVGTGGNASYSSNEASVVLSKAFGSFSNAWRKANGNQVPIPSTPSINFSRFNTVTFFLGQKPTGGYGVEVRSTRVENNRLIVEVATSKPREGLINTQALTSPWFSIQVEGNYQSVDVVEGDSTLASAKAQ